MSQKNKTKPEIYDFIYEDKYLCITCPKCKKIPFLSFDKKNPELINIKCEQCGYSSTNHLNNYLKGLSSKNIFPIKKCEKHTNFLNKYCHKCNIQFCSECEEKAIHSNHYVITLTKKFKSEKIKEVKEIIEVYKNDFKTYIRTFMQKYFNNFPKNKHIYITNDLLKNYIQDMKNFSIFVNVLY
jgi:thiol-disulfide isomerase/thioredoxin